MSVLPDARPWGGIRRSLRLEGDDMIAIAAQEIAPVLDRNKVLRDLEDRSWMKNEGHFHRVASIPLVVIEAWLKEGINVWDLGKDPDVTRKVFDRLNSPEWKSLKTTRMSL